MVDFQIIFSPQKRKYETFKLYIKLKTYLSLTPNYINLSNKSDKFGGDGCD